MISQEDTNKLMRIEHKLRKASQRLSKYRQANNPDSRELDALVDLIGEQADQISMVAMPITIKDS